MTVRRSDHAERRRAIVEAVRGAGRMSVLDLVGVIGVSAETIRRDLAVLDRTGLISRVHGGAVPFEGAGYETTLSYRSAHLVAEKRRIARAVVEELGVVQSLFLDDGYTPLLVAQALAEADWPVTVVTPSLPAAAALAANERHTVIVLGGLVREKILSTSGHWVREILADLVFEAAVLGSNGITVEHGLTTPDPAVSTVKAMVMARSRRRLFVGVHTKFGVNSFARFAGVADFDALITDRGLAPFAARRFESLGPRVLRV
ncbi:DeoR/GlpR transcriptional regulator [Nakamurella flavida]|uniref:Lactose phosphotransferase system repressor n=1 Tax=Nakamurella flavida TaxID=363630 RepID=A0A938YK71_9ACTN|nr:DeoR/GlpR family DNA-binding transcription regulator [Nakamurella flavida]MBM9476679.1 DeoR/GlpR transcriptional regulator [Nakamurella flavida]MDP9778883.1 DeoR/GlpR family transcriptional regulator of sugar metabolism [Nakamurella flavida]